MASLTTWTRLEPVPRTPDMAPGLRAELADPLWMLARQWQFGELTGEDAGSPVESVVTVETAPVSRLHAGPIGTKATAGSVDITDPSSPIEPLIERRPVQGTGTDLRLIVEAGQHFMRLLAAHGRTSQQRRYLAEYAIATPDPSVEHDLASASWLSSVAGRVPDGRRIATDLLAHRGTKPALTSLPARPSIPANQRTRVVAAANAFLRWWESAVLEPQAAGDSWDPRRLEYAFAVQASLSDGHVVLRADDYRGGRLDWFEFEADTKANLGTPAAPAPSRRLVRRTMPSHAFYGGMPADRFWELEDSSVRFGSSSVGRTDLAHMLLNEFALSYGNDWFVVPLTVPVGSICAIRDLRVVDSFGIETVVSRSGAGAGDWTMFALSSRPGAAARAAGLFYLPSTLEVALEGDPIEEVAWFRDEMANLVWAVERRTESPTGGHIDRYEVSQRQLPASAAQQVTDVGDADLVYRLSSSVPTNWFPLVPVRPAGAPAGVLELELRPIRRIDADGTNEVVTPAGRFLTAGDPLVIEEEEIGREGVNARAQWELTRGAGGRYHLWLSHRVVVGRGEGSSGLVFDVARPTA
jgi:hypothetical protein